MFLAYVYRNGRYDQAKRLKGAQGVYAFLQKNLYEEEIRICDTGDNLIFQARDGIDLFNRLEEIGVNLPGIYQLLCRKALGSGADELPRPQWEQLYDSIGLSSGEIAMRQRVKKAAMAATTVADVVRLLEGTYFSACFYSEDETCCWSYFDPHDLTVRKMDRVESDFGTGWQETGEQVTLDLDARVRHHSSAEDIHTFILGMEIGKHQ
ncbi:MAG: hypothetical protein MUO40_06175 [Anaerolineaceae bacterium]|nr:hypothetical protein [Anaerolineaceae bacterium]